MTLSAMKFEFTVHSDFNFIEKFAQKFKLEIDNNQVHIPDQLGHGFIKKIITDDNLKIVVHHYRLKENFFLKRLSTKDANHFISIVFNTQEIPTPQLQDKKQLLKFMKEHQSTIQIASSALGTETLFKAGKEIKFVVVGIPAELLTNFLQLQEPNAQIQTILKDEKPFFFHEPLTADIQRILDNLYNEKRTENLQPLFYRIKALELIYLLFSKLVSRQNAGQYDINRDDVIKLEQLRQLLLEDISTPPHLDALTQRVGLSKTKMKRLFKQVYGRSIYDYYLNARMEQAAYLLKHASISVSEVGYQIGYVNLSHFSRIFKKYYGVSPKKYISDR